MTFSLDGGAHIDKVVLTVRGTVPGISGAAILGDGRVGLILDVAGLVALDRARADGEPARSAA